MEKYDVTIRATITKTIQVDAEDKYAAAAKAHKVFSSLSDAHGEGYEQETLEVKDTSTYIKTGQL